MILRAQFTKELEALKSELLKMGNLALEAIQSAVMAFLSYDENHARSIINNDRTIDLMEVKIDNKVLSLLALEQPVARDLRFIVAVSRMNTEIERIADQAVNIAQRAIRLAKLPPICQPPDFEKLYQVSIYMISQALKSFADDDVELARKVCEMDDEADDANYNVLKESINFIVDHPSCAEQAIQNVIVARCLERSADIATNIAENVIFIVEGKNIKHEAPKSKKSWD